jgi:hypothetical protein
MSTQRIWDRLKPKKCVVSKYPDLGAEQRIRAK